ncbi:MAG: hypothetical protein HC915_11205 [Anaerolineae bacterium]|nr:hypothetical protein [Anaerolineae bacterium]
MPATGRAISVVQTLQQQHLSTAIQQVNQAHQGPFSYRAVLLTAPRRGWVALVLEQKTVDWFLLRQLSANLGTGAFGLALHGVQLRYRYYHEGALVSAYESHLALRMAARLRQAVALGSIAQLDLEDPADALVAQRFQLHQQQHSWAQPSATEPLPAEVAQRYQGDVTALHPLLRSGIDPRYVQEALAPGYNPLAAWERLSASLNLPYLRGEEVVTLTEQATPLQMSAETLLDPDFWQAQGAFCPRAGCGCTSAPPYDHFPIGQAVRIVR